MVDPTAVQQQQVDMRLIQWCSRTSSGAIGVQLKPQVPGEMPQPLLQSPWLLFPLGIAGALHALPPTFDRIRVRFAPPTSGATLPIDTDPLAVTVLFGEMFNVLFDLAQSAGLPVEALSPTETAGVDVSLTRASPSDRVFLFCVAAEMCAQARGFGLDADGIAPEGATRLVSSQKRGRVA